MPYFRVEVTEVTRHELWVKAPDADTVWSMNTDDFSEACRNNSDSVWPDRSITAVDPPRRSLPSGLGDDDDTVLDVADYIETE